MELEARTCADDMIREWVRAEIDSPAWGPYYVSAGLSREDAHAPLDDGAACRRREHGLAEVRGWPNVKWMFENFPATTEWWRAEVDAGEPLLLMSYDLFHAATYNSRRPEDFAPDRVGIEERIRSIDAQLGQRKVQEYLGKVTTIEELAKTIDETGRDVAPIIVVARDEAGPLVIMEGHTRVLARTKHPPRSQPAILGLSPNMGDWKWY